MSHSINFHLVKQPSYRKVEKSVREASNEVIRKELQKELISLQKNTKHNIEINLIIKSQPRIHLATTKKCTIYQWDSAKSEAIQRRFSGGVNFNDFLYKLKKLVSDFQEKQESEGLPTTKDDIKEIIDSISSSGISKKISKNDFFTVYQEYYELCKQRVSVGNMSPRTLSKINKTKEHLEAYCKKQKVKINFSTINEKFDLDLRAYMYDELNFGDNSVSKYIKQLKTFLNHATKQGHNLKLDYKDFDTKEPEIEVIALTENELIAFSNHKFLGVEKMKVKDMYLFSCFTGLRYGDIVKLKHDDVIDNILDITTEKTKQDIRFPLNHPAIKILNKYKDKDEIYALPQLSNSKINLLLKIMFERVEVNSPTKSTRSVKKEKIKKIRPKYELITFHSARRTFVTRLLESKMDSIIVKEMTGHKSDKEFLKYFNLTDEQKKEGLEKAFKKL